MGKIERLDPLFDKLIPKDAKIIKVAEGFKWCEGPVWMPAKGVPPFLRHSQQRHQQVHARQRASRRTSSPAAIPARRRAAANRAATA